MSPYTYSKRACEEMIKMYRFNYGLKCSIVRFFNVYGPREPQTGEWATVIAKFAELHREGKPMTVVGNGEQRRDFTHVLDICEGLYRISKMGDDERVMQHPLDLGRGDSKSINEVVKMFEPNPIENTHYVFVPLRKNEPLLTQADIDKTEAILGWRSTLDLSKYIAQISNSNGII
jgi:UDP-glucose 4-epimerase